MDVVGDGEVELAVAVVVDEGAAGAPFLASAGDAGLLGYFLEGPIALVVEEAVVAVAGDIEVVDSRHCRSRRRMRPGPNRWR